MSFRNLAIVAAVAILGGYAWQKGLIPAGNKDASLVEQKQARESCTMEFKQVKDEIIMRMQYAQYYGDMRAIYAYRPLAFEMVAIGKRLQNPGCDLAQERQRIRVIRAMLMPQRR